MPGTASSIAQLAAAECKSVEARAKLPASVKSKVEEICKQEASGNQAGAEATARRVCVEAINSIPGPKTPEKEKALAECAAKK